MPTIAELRSRLQKAQKKSATFRLSRSQCIDILFKVCNKRGITLIPTINGDELLTVQQLESEVVAAVESQGGRVSMSDLAALVGVQRNHVERAVERILTESPETYMKLQDTLITTEYTDKLMVIANMRLQECGILNVCDFASEFELPFDMLKALVSKTKVIEGKLNGNVLESYIYEEAKERCVRASLVGTTVPVSTMHIASVLKLDINLVNAAINRLWKKGTLNGTLKGGIYTPKVYTEHRNASMVAFYNASGYIEKNKIEKQNLDSTSSIFPDGIALETVIVDKKLIEPVAVLVNEAIANTSWCNVAIMLPSALTNADVSLFLDHLKRDDKSGYIVEGVYVTMGFEKSFLKHLVDTLKERKDPQTILEEAAKDFNHIYDEVNTIMEGESDSSFGEFWSLASQGFYERAQTEILAMMKASIAEMAAGTKGTANLDELSALLKEYYMKFTSTLKVMEKICNGTADVSHILMKTMAKELMPKDCHALLQYYATNNRIEIPGESHAVDSNNRNAVIEDINDKEIKQCFKDYLEGLKAKDSLKCIDASKSLRAAMYITCNIKNEKKTFIKTQTVYYRQQLAALGSDETAKIFYCVINLALLQGGHYLFIVDKEWCLTSCMDYLEGIINDPDLMASMRKCLNDQGKADCDLKAHIVTDTEAAELCKNLML